MARERDLSKLERNRARALEEIRILQKKLNLKQSEVDIINDELQVAIRYTTSPKAKRVKERLEQENQKQNQ